MTALVANTSMRVITRAIAPRFHFGHATETNKPGHAIAAHAALIERAVRAFAASGTMGITIASAKTRTIPPT